MKALKRVTALGLVGAMLGPSAAAAAGYPRLISVEGLSCIEKLGPEGELETWCQSGDQMRLVSVDPDGPPGSEGSGPAPAPLPEPSLRWSEADPVPARQARSARFSLGDHQLRSPYAAAQVAAQQNAHAGRYFAGGFAGGFILGPLGWLIAGLTANSSDVYIPSALPSGWTPAEQSHFVYTYTSEVRSKRTSNALIGGICGTVALGLLATVIVASSD